MSFFEHLEYRSLLAWQIEQKKASPRRLTLARLAAKAMIQPSYLTHVLKGRAHLSADQLDALAEALGLSSEEAEYLDLLLAEERSASARRKAKFRSRLDELRAQSLKTERHLRTPVIESASEAAQSYYLDPFCQLAHVFLGFEENAREPERIASRLGLTHEALADVLDKLERAGVIARAKEGGGYRILTRNRHLPKESALCQPHQILMRYKSIDQLQKLPEADRTSFSVTFSATESDKKAIHREFLKFVNAAESVVKGSQREHVYQINFDLFLWG